jgi:hypothetical protein
METSSLSHALEAKQRHREYVDRIRRNIISRNVPNGKAAAGTSEYLLPSRPFHSFDRVLSANECPPALLSHHPPKSLKLVSSSRSRHAATIRFDPLKSSSPHNVLTLSCNPLSRLIES